MAGKVGLQTQHRYGHATIRKSDFGRGHGNRWANRHTGSVEVYTRGRKFVHVDVEAMQIGRVFGPDLGIVSDAKAALELFVEVARERKKGKLLTDRTRWVAEVQKRKRTLLRRTDFKNTPIKPQRVFHEINQVWGNPRDRDNTCFVSSIGLGQIASGQFQKVFKPRNYIICGQAGPLGWIIPAAIGVKLADPAKEVVGIGGDYDFQFLIEELAVGAQFNVPLVFVLINNSYLGSSARRRRGTRWTTRCSSPSRTSTRRSSASTASTSSRSPRAWAARRSACSTRRRSRSRCRPHARRRRRSGCRWWWR
jgi:tartronate-semialdehyde synthase